jgi:murein DD-endopeptidase MepM/ murein hydrolase activator NlpD
MQEHAPFYPVKITSRSIAKKRFKRVSWFVLGASFGIGCALVTLTFARPSVTIASKSSETPETLAQQHYDAPVTKSIDIVAFALPPVATNEAAKTKSEAKSAPSVIYPIAMDMKVQNGDTLMNLLTDAGATYDEAQNAVDSLRTVYNPKKLDIGQNISITLDKSPDDSASPVITSVKVPTSATSTIEIVRKSGQNHDFEVKKIIEPVERRLAHAGGKINSSLYETGVTAGIPASLLNDIINAYSYDVDFQRDIQPGDSMDVLYERLETKDGASAGHGNMLYAELNLSGDVMRIYRYVDKSGFVDFYNQNGESLKKAMLRTPINGAKITSGYGMRTHPLLGYSKMHRGVDFGAATGTPIYAAGDGVVDFSGRKGGYGNYLRIKHNNKYSSAYGHISRFASNVAPGRHVKQGQIVAYVGSTGMATGPHLHYEIMVNNEQVNPSNVKFKAGNILAGKEMASFRKNMNQIEAQRDSTPRKTDVAEVKSKKLQVAQAGNR